MPEPHRLGKKREYTDKQGHYLAFIHYYTKVNGQPPAEADLQRYFQVSPPTVHTMLVTLTERGWIAREPGRARAVSRLNVFGAKPTFRTKGGLRRPSPRGAAGQGNR